jgi:hypothetical protein
MSSVFVGTPLADAWGMGHSMKQDAAPAFVTLLIISSMVAFFAASADAGQGPGYFLKSESTTGLEKICVYGGPQGNARLTVIAWQLCPYAMPTPTVSPTLVPQVSPEPQTLDSQILMSGRVVPLVDPSEQLAQIRAQHEASHVRQQIAITAATINARANDTDELVAGLLTLWEEEQVRLTEVFAVAHTQGVLLDAQADEILHLRQQLADARSVKP